MSESITLGLILGLAVMFGLSVLMTYMTYQDIPTFFIWLNIFAGFVVWSGLVPLWIVVLTLIAVGLLIIINLRKGGNI